MTSANVSNVPIQVATSKAAPVAKGGKSDVQDQFLQVMNASMKTESKRDLKMEKNPTVDTTVKLASKQNEIKSANNDNVSDEVVTQVKEDVEQFVEDVKEVLEDELDVTEEEIAEAMETLGLTILDMTDHTSLTQVVSELTECESNADLLIDEKYSNVLSQVRDLTKGLVEETGFLPKDLQQMFDETVEEQEVVLMDGEDVSQDVMMPEFQQTKEVTVGLNEVNAMGTAIVEETAGQSMTEDLLKAEQMNPGKETADVTTNNIHVEPKAEKIMDAQPDENAFEAVETKENILVDEPKDSVEDKEITDEQILNVSTEETTNENKQSDAKNDFSGNREMKNQVVPEHNMPQMGNATIERFEPLTGEITMPNGETVSSQEIMDQIVERMHTTISAKETSVEMLLNPEGLGKVLMEVSEQNGRVDVKIVTQSEEVKQLLENQMIQLKDQMNHNDTKVNSIEVSVGTHEFERNLEEGQQDRQQEEAYRQQENKRTRNLNLNNLDELSGLMTEEEELVTKMMRENGNSVNFTA